MPLFTTLAALSTVADNNPPDGVVDPPSSIDNQLRLLGSFIAQVRDMQWSLRNRLRNGNFAINQRAVSGTVTLAAGAYGHDGWKAGAGGCTYTFAASGNSTVITISAGSLLQIVESGLVEGGTYALSNQGTAQARIAVNGAATSGAYAAATTAAPLLSASATANQQVTVEFTTGTLDRVQLEPGIVATTFERRPPSVEQTICERYLEPMYIVHSNSPSTQNQTTRFRSAKRAIPSLTVTQLAGSGQPTYSLVASGVGLGVYQDTAPTGLGTSLILASCEL